MRIVVDAMGGDRGPAEIVKGVIEAVNEYKVNIILCGQKTVLYEILKQFDYNNKYIEILHADEVINMNEPPLISIRQKKNSSINIGLNALKENQAECFISTGNTGAVTAAATLKLRLIEGVERAGITALMPNVKNSLTTLIDVGANVDSKPRHLLHYSLMATEFVKEILGINNPSIGLLNVGEEDSKGNEFSKQTFELLKNNIKNFYGNVEGKDVFLGTTDVIVCDGFTGNVVLKSSEQLAKMFFSLIKNGVTQKLRYKIGAYLMKGCFKKIKKLTSDSEYGGAQLLGINGYCTICHGNSSALAIKNAIRVSKEFYEKSINDKIKQRIIDINK